MKMLNLVQVCNQAVFQRHLSLFICHSSGCIKRFSLYFKTHMLEVQWILDKGNDPLRIRCGLL